MYISSSKWNNSYIAAVSVFALFSSTFAVVIAYGKRRRRMMHRIFYMEMWKDKLEVQQNLSKNNIVCCWFCHTMDVNVFFW